MRARGSYPVAQKTPPDLGRIAALLREAGYTPEALKQLLHITVPDDVGWLNRAPALERIRADQSPAATLMRLFFLEAEEASRRVAAIFSVPMCEQLIAAGVLRARDGRVCARVRIDPVGDRYFAADRRFHACDPGALRLCGHDPVYPPSSDSLLLRDVIVAPPVPRLLDLCTGSGIQALHGASSASHVIAVDLNPRAAAMARVNASLNGVDNIELRVGDLYAPVAGEQFDLIVANPPFVSSPYDTGPSYHSGGSTGDRVLRRVIAGFTRHLRAGGRAFAVSHVALRVGETLDAVAARWFRGFPGRALVLKVESGTPIDLAAAQSLFALRRGLAHYTVEVRRWVEHLRRHRVETVVLVLLAAQRDGRTGVEVVDAQPRVLPVPLTPSPADRIRSWCAAQEANLNRC